MVNKDKLLDVSQKLAGTSSQAFFAKQTPYDQNLICALINDVNSYGYHIQYMVQLQGLDKNDKVLVPVLLSYYDRFENHTIKMNILGYLGKRGLTDITEFLIAEFKKTDTVEGAPYDTRRSFVASALLNIKDKRYIKTYIEFVQNPDTRYDSMLIVFLLGKLKAEQALPVLVEALKDPNEGFQTSAIHALGNVKGHTELIPLLEPFLKSENKNHRGQARKAINKVKGKHANSEWER